MADLTMLHPVTTLDIPPERVLRGGIEADLDTVIVIGLQRDGAEYIAASTSDLEHIVWLLERAKLDMLRRGDD